MWSRLSNGGSLLPMAMSFCHLVGIKGITMTGRLTTQRMGTLEGKGVYRMTALLPTVGFISLYWYPVYPQYSLLILWKTLRWMFKKDRQVSCSALLYLHFSLFFVDNPASFVITQWYLSIEMGMNWVWQDAIIDCPCGYISFALISKFISVFLIAYICVVLEILLWTCCWFLCELLSLVTSLTHM